MRDVAERLLNVATLGADIVERLILLLVLKAMLPRWKMDGFVPDLNSALDQLPVLPTHVHDHKRHREVQPSWSGGRSAPGLYGSGGRIYKCEVLGCWGVLFRQVSFLIAPRFFYRRAWERSRKKTLLR